MPRSRSQTGDEPKLQISVELDQEVSAQAGREKRSKAFIFNHAVKRALDQAEAEMMPLDHPTHFGRCECSRCKGKSSRGIPGPIGGLPASESQRRQRGCADSTSVMPAVAILCFLGCIILATTFREERPAAATGNGACWVGQARELVCRDGVAWWTCSPTFPGGFGPDDIRGSIPCDAASGDITSVIARSSASSASSTAQASRWSRPTAPVGCR